MKEGKEWVMEDGKGQRVKKELEEKILEDMREIKTKWTKNNGDTETEEWVRRKMKDEMKNNNDYEGER